MNKAHGKYIPSIRCESEPHWYREMMQQLASDQSSDQKQKWSGVLFKM